MKPSSRPSTEKPRRRQILDAALECFLENGFEGTTIEHIRQASGASHGSIYHHFGSKEAVALALYVEGMHEYQETVLARVERESSAEAGVRALIDAHLECVEADPNRSLFLTRLGMAEVSEEAADRIAAINQEFFRAVHAWLLPYIEQGEAIRIPAALYVPLILGPTTHYARHWLAHRLALNRAEVIEVLARSAWNSIRADAPPDLPRPPPLTVSPRRQQGALLAPRANGRSATRLEHTMHTNSAPGRSLLAWNGLLSRRDLLRVGSVGAAATLLPELDPVHARPAAKENRGTARSVIVLWMAGGVTHVDSFDPKPEALDTIRGTLTAINTTIAGVQFCESLPQLARQAQHLAVVRSFSHDSNDHFLSQAYVLSGRKVTPAQITTEPNVGAIVSNLHGGRGGLPGYITVPGTTRPGPPPKNLFGAGWLGAQYGPFACGGTPKNEDFTAKVAEASEEQFNQQALQLPPEMDLARLRGRHSLRERLEAGLRQADRDASLREQYQSAFAMLTSPAVRQAFDLRRERDATRDAYGRTKIGQRCLLARRLVEAGARFILVDYGYDPEYGNLWDNHRVAIQNQPHICDIVKLPYHLAGVDRAFAALLADLHDRGRLKETLVVFLTEFGRTPKISKLGGRDHWGAAGSIFFAGGGSRGGQVIGATDKQAAFPTGMGFTPGDIAATIYHAIGIDPDTILRGRDDRPQVVLPQGNVIPGVLG